MPAGLMAKGFFVHAEGDEEWPGGWNIELLSWTYSSNKWLTEWVIEKGHFTSLDQFYRSITFLEP